MTSETPTVPWLLVLMSVLTIGATVAIAAVVAAPSWVMLGFAVAAVIAGALVVVAAIVHELGEED